jgi:hypothetical protein
MKMSVLAAASAAALLGSAAPTLAYADVAFNVGAATDYRYRGISQSRLKPAVQGGVEYSQGGFYLGAWGSSIIKGEINKELTCDVGRQKIDGPYDDVAACTDHSLTVTKGFTVSLALISTDADKAWYVSHRPANS